MRSWFDLVVAVEPIFLPALGDPPLDPLRVELAYLRVELRIDGNDEIEYLLDGLAGVAEMHRQ